jgi:hypothetical protein
MKDAAEWEETLNVLQYLASPDLQGKRTALARTLAKAQMHKPDEVRDLLRHISWASRKHLDPFFRLRVIFEHYWLKLWGQRGRD